MRCSCPYLYAHCPVFASTLSRLWVTKSRKSCAGPCADPRLCGICALVKSCAVVVRGSAAPVWAFCFQESLQPRRRPSDAPGRKSAVLTPSRAPGSPGCPVRSRVAVARSGSGPRAPKRVSNWSGVGRTSSSRRAQPLKAGADRPDRGGAEFPDVVPVTDGTPPGRSCRARRSAHGPPPGWLPGSKTSSPFRAAVHDLWQTLLATSPGRQPQHSQCTQTG